MQQFGRARHSCLVALLCAGGWVLSVAPGQAQQASQGQATQGQATQGQTTQGWLFNLTGVGQDIGPALADKGIYLTGRYLGEGLYEASGGRKQGAFNEEFTSFGADFDMSKIAGIKGGIVHLLISDLAGQSYAGYSGSFFTYAKPYAYQNGLRLNEFSYEQELFDNRVRILAGRINPAGDFDTDSAQCTFLSTLCSAPAGYLYDKSAAPYLTSAWGVTTTLKPSKPTYVKFGVFEDETFLSDTNQGAWPGKDWDMQSANGATIPVEMGYRTNAQNDAYPRGYDIGGFYDTASYADPLLNTAGQARELVGGAPKEDIGRSGVYFQAQQMVYRPDPNSDRGLTLFASGNWTTSGETEIANDVSVGVIDKGLFASRPNDYLGVATTFIESNHRITERIDDEIIKQGGTGHVSSEEGVLEVDYGIGLAPGITLIPFMQYLSHPDQYTDPNPSSNLNYSFMVGTALAISFSQALGLPQLMRGAF